MTPIRQVPTALALGSVLAVSVVASMVVTPAAHSIAPRQATVAPTRTPVPTPVPVGGKLQAENACYVRLPYMPRTPYSGPGRFGLFGGYNPESGVLVAAGGKSKSASLSTTFYQMYAIKLDSPAAQWQQIPYTAVDGYTREFNKGCHEMASVRVTDDLALSVLGKSGCDDGEISGGGDVRGVSIGATADRSGVGFVPGMRVASAPPLLLDNNLGLIDLFAVYDSTRNRAVFGQGTFKTVSAPDTRPEVYEATRIGTRWKINQMFPAGPLPERRYGSCGSYVRDAASELDGVLVLGGTQGGVPGTTESFNQVWWLDFSGSDQGRWVDITARFSNQDDLGYRYQGACAYDTETKYFYTWMGKANPSVPDGATLSNGAWRVSLAQLGDPTVPLTWERLAQDDMTGIQGRREIPSVWDDRNKRMFVLGGRLGSNEFDVDELLDVWAIYPALTGEACTTLDPYAPYAPANPTATPARPAIPTAPSVPVTPQACPQLARVVPAAVVAAAIASPETIQGWGQLQNPNLPFSPRNPYRTRLGLQNPSTPYNPMTNNVVFKAGCP